MFLTEKYSNITNTCLISFIRASKTRSKASCFLLPDLVSTEQSPAPASQPPTLPLPVFNMLTFALHWHQPCSSTNLFFSFTGKHLNHGGDVTADKFTAVVNIHSCASWHVDTVSDSFIFLHLNTHQQCWYANCGSGGWWFITAVMKSWCTCM